MVTKNDERKALEKIKKIVEELGDDSYIAVAFEGCFDIAEDNINNDMACSMKQRYDMADKEAWDAQKQNAELKEEVQKVKMAYEHLAKEIKTKDQMLEQERSMKREIKKELDVCDRQIEELETQVARFQESIVSYEDELVHLKAKMYDMICGQ